MQINLLNLQKEEIDSKIGWTITSLSLRDILTRGQLSRYVIARNANSTICDLKTICLDPGSDIVIFLFLDWNFRALGWES